MRKIGRLNILTVILASAALGGARDIYVATNGPGPSPFTTWNTASSNIEWAVNAGTNGDFVWISNGVYVLTNQVTIRSNLTICGISANDRPVVDGNNAVRCFSNVASTKIALSNLFITRGYALGDGGGAYLRNATAWDCVFSNNIATNTGGGMYLAASGSLHRCAFVNNKAWNWAGLCYYSGTSKIDHCVFHTNIAGNIGGGMYGELWGKVIVTGCNFTCNVGSNGRGGAYYYHNIARGPHTNMITHCNFISNVGGQEAICGGLILSGSNMWLTNSSVCDNITGKGAGGIYLVFGKIMNCLIARNTATNKTTDAYGGIYVSSSAGPLIQNCIIEENRSGGSAGGVALQAGEMRNCLIRKNIGGNGTGGLRLTAGDCTISSCTIVSNYSSGDGGGVYVHIPGAKIENCIIFNNTCAVAARSNYYFNTTSCSVSNSCLAPALTGDVTNYSANNITSNPQFVDKDSDNWHLPRESSCVNAGVNREWMAGASDMEGHRRIDAFSGITDMGCFENLPSGTLIRIP